VGSSPEKRSARVSLEAPSIGSMVKVSPGVKVRETPSRG